VGTNVDKTPSARTKRPNFPLEFKRHLVEQSFEPGASVALIARRNDVNANLLFKWRRAYLEGAYGPPTRSEHAARQAEREIPPLLPVHIIDGTPVQAPPPMVTAAEPLESVCEVEFERARLRIRGDVSPDMLRLLIRELSR
jgi:transposase